MAANTKSNPVPERPDTPVRAAGIGLRGPHYQDILDQTPDIGWIEVHPENYFGGGAHRHYLTEARKIYALSFHAVGLSLGSDQPVNETHLSQLKELINIYEPFQVSDHASWSASGNAHLNDLLPLPYTEETVSRLCENVNRTQEYLNRRILVENPSTYLSFTIDEMTEYDFMNEIHARTGCGLLLDINNIYVQSKNHDFDAYDYVSNIQGDAVCELHLAGHVARDVTGGTILVDTHNRYVCDDVWDLYEHAIKTYGPVPTLIEWDSDLPALSELVGEADKAQAIIDSYKDAEGQARAAE
jgi:hypothetical protein